MNSTEGSESSSPTVSQTAVTFEAGDRAMVCLNTGSSIYNVRVCSNEHVLALPAKLYETTFKKQHQSINIEPAK